MARRSEKYDRAFSALREIVNRHDPIGLIATGAPQDEYDPEVTDLVRMVVREELIEEEAVDAVWIRWFGSAYRMSGTDDLTALTRDIRDLQARLISG